MVNTSAKLFTLLFTTTKPVSTVQLMDICSFSAQDLQTELKALAKKIEPLGLSLIEHNQTYRLATQPQYAAEIKKLQGSHHETLSGAALEVLAIIAYRQPVSRAQIDDIRGVGSEQTIKSLLARKLIAQTDQKIEHQITYKTTGSFLQHLGITHINKLPKINTHAANNY